MEGEGLFLRLQRGIFAADGLFSRLGGAGMHSGKFPGSCGEGDQEIFKFGGRRKKEKTYCWVEIEKSQKQRL